MRTLSGFTIIIIHSQGCRWRSNPGLELANAFGVFQAESAVEKCAAFAVLQMLIYNPTQYFFSDP